MRTKDLIKELEQYSMCTSSVAEHQWLGRWVGLETIKRILKERGIVK